MRMHLIKRAMYAALFVCLSVGMLACNKGPDDATTTATVKTKLAADTTVPATAINVDTKEGVVTLTGTVDTEAQKTKAEQIAKGVEGVKSVTTNIPVTPPPPPPPPIAVSPDTELKNTVMANLTKEGVTTVTVDVANGEVTLKGDIPRAKLQAAMKAANEAKPRKVNNQMNIK
jgi:hyperosmotically inducible periplasmic protein